MVGAPLDQERLMPLEYTNLPTDYVGIKVGNDIVIVVLQLR